MLNSGCKSTAGGSAARDEDKQNWGEWKKGKRKRKTTREFSFSILPTGKEDLPQFIIFAGAMTPPRSKSGRRYTPKCKCKSQPRTKDMPAGVTSGGKPSHASSSFGSDSTRTPQAFLLNVGEPPPSACRSQPRSQSALVYYVQGFPLGIGH